MTRYGIRGALKPPLGRPPWLRKTLWYRWRHLCWRADDALYRWCEIGREWEALRNLQH